MVSIIIPAWNSHNITEECLCAIEENTTGIPYEIVLVDNGSEPPYAPSDKYHLIRCDTNTGFSHAINISVPQATGDVIVLLNNDIVVTPDWLQTLLNNLRTDYFSDIGYDIIGPVTNYSAGVQQVSVPIYTNETELYRSARIHSTKESGKITRTNWIIGFLMVFTKATWDSVGCFDESLWPCCGEEVDFCLRAERLGYKIGVIHECYVHHHGSQTFRDMQNSGILDYKDICERNEDHLSSKWGDMWYNQLAEIPLDYVKLNLGCGYDKLNGYINIDNRGIVNPDLVCDVLDGLPYADSSVDEVRAYDFLEHIPIGKTVQVVNEIWRVLKPGGIFESHTPSTDGRAAFQDPTHQSFWNQNSWLYFSDPESRTLYSTKANFFIEEIHDIVENQKLKIIHTYVKAIAVKS